MTRLRSQCGQVTVLTAIFMVGMLGLGGFVLDVGGWFRQQRVSQATVDAAALAGAQALPTDPATAMSLATQYANDNGGSNGATFTVSSTYIPNDTIAVTQAEPASGLFSGLFGVGSATTHAKATAIAEIPTEVTGAAPIVVSIDHPMLSGNGCPCFDVPTTISLGKKGVPGAFGLVDFDNDNGTAGKSTLASWIQNGYQNYLPLGMYDSDPGAAFNSTEIQAALTAKVGVPLLFPIYDSVGGTGSNAPYHIVGWASFVQTQPPQSGGNSGTLTGYFDRVIWDGIIPTDGSGDSSIPDFGVYSVALVN